MVWVAFFTGLILGASVGVLGIGLCFLAREKR